MEVLGIALLLLFFLLTASRQLIWTKSALTAALLIALSSWWFINRLSGNGIDPATLYHLKTGLGGAGVSGFWFDIVMLALMLAASLLPLLTPVLRHRLPAGSGTIFPAFVLCLLLCIITSPVYGDLKRLNAYVASVSTDGVIAELRVPSGLPPERKNVLLIYAEGLERTYLNETLFPGLTPNLKRLSSEALDFRDVRSLDGSGWTIAGLVSSMCGMPLTAWDSSDVNSFERIDGFLPGANCLGDYLRSEGYFLEFIGGAPQEFAGKGKFLRSHGFNVVKDTEFFQDSGYPPEDFASWGVHDDVLLDHVYERFMELSATGDPFLLSALTVDTHHPSGSIPRSCADVRHASEQPMLDAVKCSDRLIAQLIDRVRASRYANNTIIVLTSDHVALPNDVIATLRSAEPRKNLVLAFDRTRGARVIETPGSTYDTGSTLLQLMGVTQPQVGFGRSMLSPTWDGASKAFQDGKQLSPYISYSRSLWRLDQVGTVRLVGSTLVFGKQRVALPLGFSVSAKGEVDAVHLTAQLDNNRIPSKRQGRVDRCAAFTLELKPDDWCLLLTDEQGHPHLFGQGELTKGIDLTSHAPAHPEVKIRLTGSFIIEKGFQSDFPFLINGEVLAGSVHSKRMAGLLMTGPYKALDPGSYRLTVFGATTTSPDAWLDVVSGLGTLAHTRGPLAEPRPKDNVIFEGEFTLSKPATDIEIRINAGTSDSVRIDGYTVLPIPQATAKAGLSSGKASR